MLWFRKVLLFDTLLENHSDDEIIAIVNHELGHVHHMHVAQHTVMAAIQLVIMFVLFSFANGNKGILEAFGFDYTSKFICLFLFTKLYMPVDFITRFISMHFVRLAEFEADAFAVDHKHGPGLKSGLISLFKRSKAPLVADPLFSAFNHSHPTLVERLSAIDGLLKTRN